MDSVGLSGKNLKKQEVKMYYVSAFWLSPARRDVRKKRHVRIPPVLIRNVIYLP